ncbi:unnamed protein product [Musa acuminata subsp. malaccensis]|uniref:(wild Malaysian banana) hypothetical protein n=1 Tax=Musa acuminata subsp. malaccensis TaxID=214687 RepID=A0A804JWX2_MUSAM|nr:unnamed protein product [Musa acuminata subsp. malaccensis]
MEAGSPPAAPADPFDEFFPQQHGCGSDADVASPSASNYSSCDGEDSELERYCSANSALGSASLCSSVGNYADLLDFSDVCGAIENSQRGRLGGDIAASWDRFNRYSEEGAVTSPRENCSSPSQHLLALSDRMGSLPRISTGSRLRPASVDRPGERTQLRVVEDQQEAVPCKGKEVDFLDRDVISMGRDDGYSGQSSLLCAMAGAEEVGSLGNLGSSSRDVMMESDEDRPSRCEHSDGEDSMLEYGTDCENANGLCENLRCIDETKHDNLNPLLMNSSVAYGSDDLDELMRENGGLGLQSLSLYQDQPNFQQTVPAKVDGHLPLLSNSHVIDPLHDVEKDEDAVDVSAVNHKFQVTDEPNSELSHKDVHVDEAPERQVFGEPASADNDTVIKISSISVGTSRHEKCFGQDYDKPSLLLPVVHSGQSSSFQIELDRSLNFTDLSEENIVTDEAKTIGTTCLETHRQELPV